MVERHFDGHALQRQLRGPNAVALEFHSRVDVAQFSNVEFFRGQYPLPGLGFGRRLPLPGRSGGADRSVRRCSGGNTEIGEVELLRVEIGDHGRSLAAELETDIPGEVAVADGTVQRDQVPALLVRLIGELARELVGRRVRDRELQEAAELGEIGPFEPQVDAEPGQAQRAGDTAFGEQVRFPAVEHSFDRVGSVRVLQAVLGSGMDLECQRLLAEVALAARVDHRHPIAQLQIEIEAFEAELRCLDMAGPQFEVEIDRRQCLRIDVAVPDQRGCPAD